MSVITKLKYLGNNKFQVDSFQEYEERRVVETGDVFQMGAILTMKEPFDQKNLHKFDGKTITMNRIKVKYEGATATCAKHDDPTKNIAGDCWIFISSVPGSEIEDEDPSNVQEGGKRRKTRNTRKSRKSSKKSRKAKRRAGN